MLQSGDDNSVDSSRSSRSFAVSTSGENALLARLLVPSELQRSASGGHALHTEPVGTRCGDWLGAWISTWAACLRRSTWCNQLVSGFQFVKIRLTKPFDSLRWTRSEFW